METLEGIRLVKEHYPGAKTVLGVGNLTNGLAAKPYMRQVLTSVFVDEARKRGWTRPSSIPVITCSSQTSTRNTIVWRFVFFSNTTWTPSNSWKHRGNQKRRRGKTAGRL